MIAEARARLEGWLSRHESRILLWVLALGVVVKLLPILLDPARKLQPTRSEMWRVAVHWARTGVLGDAYFAGSGVSSHVGPLNTILAGIVYRLTGIASPASELILSVVALLTVAAMIWCFHHALRLAGVGVVPTLAAAVLLAVGPMDYGLEAFDFRIREGATATLLMGALLWWALRLDRAGAVPMRSLVLYGLLAGVAFLVNPVIALGAYAGLGLVVLRHLRWRQWPQVALVLAVGLALVNAPWVVRNERVYHRFMLSRGNFGLELAIANHAGALDPADPRATFQQRMNAIHPAMKQPDTIAAYRRYPQDVDYFDAMGAEARAWIGSHKAEFLQLSARHLGQLLFPPVWVYDKYGHGAPAPMARVRQAVAWVSAALAIAMLLLGLAERRRAWLFLAVTALPELLLYSLVQPTPRYRYVLVPLIIYLAAELLWRLFGRVGGVPLFRPRPIAG